MSFLSTEQLTKIPFRFLGRNVKISEKVSIYDPEEIEIGDNSRIDDFCVISGKVNVGSFVHITVFCNIAGGIEGITLEDFATVAYGCHIFTQSDDYNGYTMTNSNIPDKFKDITRKKITIGRHSIIGAGSIILPGANLAEGTSIGAGTLVRVPTEEWSIYVGVPARKLRKRSKQLLELEKQFMKEKQILVEDE
jgi:acetyltransferase-like isoleucine patch superfamily enzyme